MTDPPELPLEPPQLPICPRCTIFARRHPELLGHDLIRRPVLKMSSPNLVYVTNYCQHSEPVFGPHWSVEGAVAAWSALVEELERDLSDEKRADLAEYETRLQRFEAQAFEFTKRIT